MKIETIVPIVLGLLVAGWVCFLIFLAVVAGWKAPLAAAVMAVAAVVAIFRILAIRGWEE